MVGYFSILEFGLGTSVVKYISEYKALKDKSSLEKVIGTALTSYVLAGLLGGGLILALTNTLVSRFLNIPQALIPLTIAVFYISSFGFLVNMVLTIFNSIPLGLQRMEITNSRNVLFGFLNTLGVVVLLFFKQGLLLVVIWNILTSTIATLAFIKLIKKLIPDVSLMPSFNREIFKKLLRFGGFKFISNIGGQIVFQLDRVLIGIFLPISSVTFYTVPVSLVQKGLIMITNITAAVFPALSASIAQKNLFTTRQLYLKMNKFIALLTLPIMAMLFLFSTQILNIWLGYEFAQKSTTVLKLVAVAYFIAIMSAPGVTAADAAGVPSLSATFATISALINLAAALILIPRLGIEGAAWALLVNFLAQVPIFLWIVQKNIIKVTTLEVLRSAFLKPILAVLLAGLASSLTSFGLFTQLIAFGIIYLLVNLLVGTLDQEDWSTINYLRKKVISW